MISGHLGGTLTFTDPGDYYTGMPAIKSIRWTSPNAAAGDGVLVQDAQGDVLFRSIADGKWFIDFFPLYKWVTDINIVQLDSGTIDVVTQ